MEEIYELEDGSLLIVEDDDYRNNPFNTRVRRARSRRSSRSRRTSGAGSRIMRRRSPAELPMGGGVRAIPASSPVIVSQAPPENTISFAGKTWEIGEVIELAVSVLSSAAALPEAPVSTGNIEIDTSNQTKYQTALAKHAKRAQQVRTVGKLAGALLG